MSKKIKKLGIAAAIALGLFASSASATTVNLVSGADLTGSDVNTRSFATGGVAGTVSAGCSLNVVANNCDHSDLQSTPKLTLGIYGLGVKSNGAPSSQVDSSNGGEFVRFAFASAVNLLNFKFSTFGINGLYDLVVNNVLYGSGLSGDWAGSITDVNSFTVIATGGRFRMGSFEAQSSNNNPQVSAVPLPASGILLVAAIGGLFASRRRKAS
ncbi:MAG: VPLPA-CTERM sorting domain-containing protein [Rhodobacter sp.]|nr:VPLPA-CTERM sorting domain-containing protein [Rhodobacter sp.]